MGAALGRPTSSTARPGGSGFRRYVEDHASGTALPFFIFENETDALVGGITLGNIRYGVAQTGQIGYWMGERYAGRGLMLEALGLLICLMPSRR